VSERVSDDVGIVGNEELPPWCNDGALEYIEMYRYGQDQRNDTYSNQDIDFGRCSPAVAVDFLTTLYIFETTVRTGATIEAPYP
jgi:hypothetical protein